MSNHTKVKTNFILAHVHSSSKPYIVESMALMLAIFYYFFTMTRMVVIAFNIKVHFFTQIGNYMEHLKHVLVSSKFFKCKSLGDGPLCFDDNFTIWINHLSRQQWLIC
jgi:hypothetical protein